MSQEPAGSRGQVLQLRGVTWAATGAAAAAADTGAAALATSTTAEAEASSPEVEAEGADSSRRMADIRADSETADVKCLYCIFF